MYLNTSFLLYLRNCISRIKNGESGSVVSSFKVECGFYYGSFFVVPFNAHYSIGAIK